MGEGEGHLLQDNSLFLIFVFFVFCKHTSLTMRFSFTLAMNYCLRNHITVSKQCCLRSMPIKVCSYSSMASKGSVV